MDSKLDFSFLRRLRLHTIFLAIVVAAGVAGGISALQLSHDLRHIEAQEQEIRDVYLPHVARAVWFLDEELMRQMADGLARLYLVRGVRLHLQGGVRIDAGQPGEGRVFFLAVEYPVGGQVFHLGTLTVWLDTRALWRSAGLRWLAVMGMIVTGVIVGVGWMLRLISRQVGEPVFFLAQEIHRLGNGDWDIQERQKGLGLENWGQIVAPLEQLRHTLRQQADTLQRVKQRLAVRERLLDCLSMYVWLADTDSRIRYANAAAQTLSGGRIDLPLPSVLPPSWDAVRAIIEAVFADLPPEGGLQRTVLLEGREADLRVFVCLEGVAVTLQTKG